jgi:hypothetical protein
MVQDKETLNEYMYPKAFAKTKINITDTTIWLSYYLFLFLHDP